MVAGWAWVLSHGLPVAYTCTCDGEPDLQPFPGPWTKFVQKKSMATDPQPPSFNEQLASLESLPLFMSSLPDDPADNAALSALQSLVHDGTPDGQYYTCSPPWCYCTAQAGLTRKSHEKIKRGRAELQGTG